MADETTNPNPEIKALKQQIDGLKELVDGFPQMVTDATQKYTRLSNAQQAKQIEELREEIKALSQSDPTPDDPTPDDLNQAPTAEKSKQADNSAAGTQQLSQLQKQIQAMQSELKATREREQQAIAQRNRSDLKSRMKQEFGDRVTNSDVFIATLQGLGLLNEAGETFEFSVNGKPAKVEAGETGLVLTTTDEFGISNTTPFSDHLSGLLESDRFSMFVPPRPGQGGGAVSSQPAPAAAPSALDGKTTEQKARLMQEGMMSKGVDGFLDDLYGA